MLSALCRYFISICSSACALLTISILVVRADLLMFADCCRTMSLICLFSQISYRLYYLKTINYPGIQMNAAGKTKNNNKKICALRFAMMFLLMTGDAP